MSPVFLRATLLKWLDYDPEDCLCRELVDKRTEGAIQTGVCCLKSNLAYGMHQRVPCVAKEKNSTPENVLSRRLNCQLIRVRTMNTFAYTMSTVRT